ncbi:MULTISPECIES: hypothetical protein [unclassified Rhizobium]|uniref:hypothetical protein n=1 Tax=unclassified Rhizobium TaxID=2613769 RepID=UPI000714363A|nr:MULTISPECIES: hypothetical protein [unclassified Rhizobium]KQS96835.1 hypothetical protein ASG42_28535 [Rhizobium sp. Leaf391]KQT06818.1 hypothetical protein ASG50_13975 [Rhizobium sp. Leaf386]KQU05895.1 hypothetical protein ASG68_24320 [Rhizobium sp. Leaf453]
MSFPTPKHAIGDMNRSIECEELIHPFVAGLIDRAGSAGWTLEEVLLAIEETVKEIRSTPLPV